MRVADLFAGLGGFSAGALAAGAQVVLGVDHDPVPLKLWSANVHGARAVLATLGTEQELTELPPPSPSLHVHASSPCTDLSIARGRSASSEDVDEGVRLLQWSLDLVLKRGDRSWSIENVSTPTTRRLLAEYASAHPDRVAFATLDAAEFGAAQSRVRLIAGPPALIKLLQEMPSSRRVSVREAFAEQGQEAPAPCFKNQTRGRDGLPCRRSVEEQAFTVCASHALTWAERNGRTVKVMTARDSAVLMGFRTSWRLPKGSRAAQRAVGNALCVSMAKAIMQAAISLETGAPLPPLTSLEPPPLTVVAATSVVEDAPATDDYGRLSKRLCTIEGLVRKLHGSSPETQTFTTTHDATQLLVP